jgi:hypothetical protein
LDITAVLLQIWALSDVRHVERYFPTFMAKEYNSENKGISLLGTAGKYMPGDTTSYPRRQLFAYVFFLLLKSAVHWGQSADPFTYIPTHGRKLQHNHHRLSLSH